MVKRGYYNDLQQLIEDSYIRNNNNPVTLVAHSLGGPVATFFLSSQVQEDWKASRIKQLISLSGSFGGSVGSVRALVSGSHLHVGILRPGVLRDALRTFTSVVSLLPSLKLWGEDEVILMQSKRNYSAHDYNALFVDANYTDGSRILREVRNLTDTFPAPNITHYCFYGNNISTDAVYMYGDSFPDGEPHVRYGNGDGSVNERSLQSCVLWKDKQLLPVVTKEFPNMSHFSMISDRSVLEAIKELVMQ